MPKELSATDVKYEIENLRQNLFLEESEDSWEKIGKSITSLIKICENGGYDANPLELVTVLRSSHRPIISAMNSERTRLCLIPLELLSTLASVMGGEFEQLLSLFMQPLLTLCARTNKVIVNRARACIFSIIEYTQSASLLSYFLQNIKDKSATLKVVVVEGTFACLNSCNPPDIEKEARAVEIEAIIRTSARDANADVRKISRKMFESYQILFPSRVHNFTAPLSPTTKKYLDIKPMTTVPKPMPTARSTTRAKIETKPPTATASTAKASSSRATSSTLSTGTMNNQTRSTAPAMIRITRKEPTPASSTSSAPYVPVRPAQPTKSSSESQRATTQRTVAPITSGIGPVRMTSTQDQKRPIPPVRSQPSTLSRTTGMASSSGGANRLQLNSMNPVATTSGPQPVTTGPRRVPMPAPPAPPAPPKDKEGPKRPVSIIDNTSSTRQRPIIPPAPIKKKAVATVPSLKDRGPAAANPATAKVRSTASSLPVASGSSTATTGSSTTTTRPLVVAKAKPQWGRSAPTAKPAPGASQKAASNALVRKPSSRVLPKAAAAPSKVRSVTPAMVALPPSPTSEEDEAAVKGIVDVDDRAGEKFKAEEGIQRGEERIEEHAEEVVEQNNQIATSLTPDAENTQEEKEVEQPESTKDDVEQTSSTSADGENDLTPRSQETDESDHSSNANHVPQTPQTLLPLPAANHLAVASKTPISALLSSIEQGFAFSPNTPLSPADLYLPNANGATPYSHQTHAVLLQGPRQPFNYALHAPSANGVFSGFSFPDVKKEAELVRGDIGVIKVSDHNKLFAQVGLDDAANRHAFLELNQ